MPFRGYLKWPIASECLGICDLGIGEFVDFCGQEETLQIKGDDYLFKLY